jgi:hypothetical protein
MKKKQAAQKQSQPDEEEDPYLVNPNHIEKKLNISDLGSPRGLTRRERYVISIFTSVNLISVTGSRKRRRMRRIGTGRRVMRYSGVSKG